MKCLGLLSFWIAVLLKVHVLNANVVCATSDSGANGYATCQVQSDPQVTISENIGQDVVGDDASSGNSQGTVIVDRKSDGAISNIAIGPETLNIGCPAENEVETGNGNGQCTVIINRQADGAISHIADGPATINIGYPQQVDENISCGNVRRDCGGITNRLIHNVSRNTKNVIHVDGRVINNFFGK